MSSSTITINNKTYNYKVLDAFVSKPTEWKPAPKSKLFDYNKRRHETMTR